MGMSQAINTKEHAMTTTRAAKWMGDQYVVTDTGADSEWYSTGGDNWCDQSGRPVTDETFSESRIAFSGGPRNGEMVA